VAVKASQFLKKGERGHAMEVTVERERVRGETGVMVHGGLSMVLCLCMVVVVEAGTGW